MRKPEAKDTTLRCCYYFAIVSVSVLSNCGVLAGNKLMCGSMGSARCYVWPPLIIFNIHYRRADHTQTYSVILTLIQLTHMCTHELNIIDTTQTKTKKRTAECTIIRNS